MRNLVELRPSSTWPVRSLPEPIDSGDHRIDDLVVRFPADRPLMVVATAEGSVVGGALA